LAPAADALTAWQQAVVAGLFELCLVGVMVIYELLGHNPKSSQHPAAAARNRWWTRWRASPRAEAAPDATALPPPTRRGNAKGSVKKFINQRVSPADGERLEVKAMLQEYRGWCSSNGVEPVTLRAYLDDVEAVCHKIGIEVVREADRVFCLGMKIEEAAP
jgi:hypothetical protein